jgi:hypothetical protein|nr:MAG TPA_asm: resistance protein [Bacteriophage sp.]
MASLYNISSEILRIFENVENNEGEITDEEYNSLVIKQEELKTKLDCYVKAVKEFNASAAFCKTEKKSIDDRKKVYENRILRLKKAMLDAVNNFGELGKNNKFIELESCRLYTKASTAVNVDEDRVNLFMTHFEKFLREVVNGDVLYTGEDVDLQGILDVINANIKAEQEYGFVPFTLNDLTTFKIGIKSTATIYELFRSHKDAILEYAHNPFTAEISNETAKEDWKTIITVADEQGTAKPTMAELVKNESLIIK